MAAAGEWSPAPRFSETPDFGPGIPAGHPGGFGRNVASCIRWGTASGVGASPDDPDRTGSQGDTS